MIFDYFYSQIMDVPFCFWKKKKKHKLLFEKVICVVGVAFLLVEGIR